MKKINLTDTLLAIPAVDWREERSWHKRLSRTNKKLYAEVMNNINKWLDGQYPNVSTVTLGDKIAEFLEESGIKISPETIANYLRMKQKQHILNTKDKTSAPEIAGQTQRQQRRIYKKNQTS